MCRGAVEPDQPVRAALLPRKARHGEEFIPKLHIQPERSLGLTARTPQGPAVGPGRGGAPTPPSPAEARDGTQPPAFAGLAKVGRSVWSKMSASESSPADPGAPARTARPARPTPPAGRNPHPNSAPPPRAEMPWSQGSQRSASRWEWCSPPGSQRLAAVAELTIPKPAGEGRSGGPQTGSPRLKSRGRIEANGVLRDEKGVHHRTGGQNL
jgi:hypothetical protein